MTEKRNDHRGDGAAGQGFLQQLMQRRVIQSTAIYIAVAWGGTEILITIATPLNLPYWVPRLAVVLFVIGFPVAVFLSWALQWTTNGLRSEIRSLRVGLVISVALAMLLGSGAYFYQFILDSSRPPPRSNLDRGNVFTEVVATVGVLQFENLTGSDPELGQVFASELIERLARHPDLYVIDSESSFSPQLAGLALSTQRQKLQADQLVTGTIRREGDLNHALIEITSANGEVVWTSDMPFATDDNSLDGALRRISERVAELAGAAKTAVEPCPISTSLEAMELYHSARFRINAKGPENLGMAVEELRKSVGFDPGYGRAWELLMHAYLLSSRHAGVLDRFPDAPQNMDEMVALGRIALDHCANLGWAYKVWVPGYEGIGNKWIDQELQWLDALAMDPNNLLLLGNFTMHLGDVGHFQRNLEINRRAYRNNPLQPRAVVNMGWALMGENNERALALADEAEALGDRSCNHIMLRSAIAGYYGNDEDIKAADARFTGEYERCRQIGTGFDSLQVRAARSDPEARDRLLEEARSVVEDNPNGVMFVAIDLDELDLAYQAIALGMSTGKYLHIEFWWSEDDRVSAFRSDPRFAELVTELGLVDYWREFGWPDGMCTPLGNGVVCQ